MQTPGQKVIARKNRVIAEKRRGLWSRLFQSERKAKGKGEGDAGVCLGNCFKIKDKMICFVMKRKMAQAQLGFKFYWGTGEPSILYREYLRKQ